MTDETVARSTPAPASRLTTRVRGLSDRAIAWIFVAPTILLLLAINIFPLIWTIRLSLTDFRANRANRPIEWVGIDNYRRILGDAEVNIAGMQVSRDRKGGKALVALAVDSAIATGVLDDIAGAVQADTARTVDLEA